MYKAERNPNPNPRNVFLPFVPMPSRPQKKWRGGGGGYLDVGF